MNERVACTGCRQPEDRLEMASGKTDFWKEFFSSPQDCRKPYWKKPHSVCVWGGDGPTSTEQENPAAAAIRLIRA